MKHLGDITKISGYDAPTVDVIVGGSPCQDLSMAGKRAGLDGERSGLFMEQIRIIKEMRNNDVQRNGRTGVDVRPRYMVWENVPGAFSSNKGEDFRIVLEETAKIADENAVIPQPADGKWKNSGCILGDGWSIAWRVLDAQFWGVPQRRRRIALVADFGGESASEILFVRNSVSGHSQPSQSQGEATSEDATRVIGAEDRKPKLMEAYQHHGWRESDTCGALTAEQNNHVRGDTPLVAYSFEPGIASREGGHIYENVSGTLRANAGDNQMSAAYTMKIRSGCEVDSSGKQAGKGALIQTDKSGTLSCVQDQYLFQPVQCIDQGGGKSSCNVQEGQAPTLTCTHGGEPAVCYSIENHPADSRVDIDESGKVQTLTSRMGTGGGNVPMVMESVVASDRASYNQGKNAQFDIGINESGTAQSIVAKGPGAVAYGVETSDGEIAGTLDASYYKGCGVRQGRERTFVATAVDCRNGTEGEINNALQSAMAHNINSNNVVRTKYTVRRLTPLECERLQGYPDGWTDIGEWEDTNGKVRRTSDANRYKALGNSIALPPWKWVMKRISACYERDATLASLFDGIGGFPYIWEQINGKGSCLWASEIEEFPIAVTKRRINNG